MPSRLPKLLIVCGWILVAAPPVAILADDEAAHRDTVASREQSFGDPTAHSLLQDAERRLASYPTITAQIRQRIEMFGQKMAGSGSYQQLRTRRRPKWRFELSMKAGDSDIRLERMCDGQTLWIVRQFDQTQSQQRIDLDRVRERLGKDTAKLMGMLEFSALSEMVANLRENFEFDKAEPVLVSKVEMWSLSGTWLSGKPGIGKAGGAVQIPSGVTILLGRDDKIPYRIEFFRNTPNGRTQLVVTELYGVGLGIAIEPGRFRPEAADFVDSTEQFINDRRALLKQRTPSKIRR